MTCLPSPSYAVAVALVFLPALRPYKCTVRCFEWIFPALVYDLGGIPFQALPDDGVTVFAGLPHMHDIGRAVRLRHLRRGVEMAVPFQDRFYDPNFQTMRRFQLRLLPQDHLMMECVYNSTDRRWLTRGGYSAKQEMCLMFLHYYPASRLAQCTSRLTLKHVRTLYLDCFFRTFVPVQSTHLITWRFRYACLRFTRVSSVPLPQFMHIRNQHDPADVIRGMLIQNACRRVRFELRGEMRQRKISGF